MRRNSLTSMLGEFIGFHKSPDFRLTSMSNQDLNAAVKSEKRQYLENEKPEQKMKPRQRYLSEGDIRITPNFDPADFGRRKRGVQHNVSSNPDGSETPVNVVMRNKTNNNNGTKRKDRPTSLIERIRRKISYTKTGAIIESDEEHYAHQPLPNFTRRRDSTTSEKLFIPITPVEAVPIRIVQVSN